MALVVGFHPYPSLFGIVWTGVTAAAMFARAAGKARVGSALDNPVLRTEGQVTVVDGVLATAVLVGLGAQRRPRLVVGRPGGRLRPRVYGAREARTALV